MKKTCIFILLVLLNLGSAYTQVQLEWERRYNSSLNAEDDAYSIDIDSAGNSYVTGRSYNGSNYDIVTLKYSQSGNQSWSRTFNGGPGLDDSPVKVKIDFQKNVVTAGNTGNITSNKLILLKHSNDGTMLWSKIFYGPQNAPVYCGSMDIDLNGNIYTWNGSSESPNGTFLLAKFNLAGDTLWTRKFKDTLNAGTYPKKVICADSGYIYTLCHNSRFVFLIKYDQSGNIIWVSRRINIVSSDFCINNRGDIFVTGSKYEGTGRHFYTFKYNTEGILKWEATYSEQFEEPYSVLADNEGNCYVTGNNVYSGNQIIVKYDSAGNQLWIKKINSNLNGSTCISSVDKSNNIYIANSMFVNSIRRIITLWKYNPAGSLIYSYQYLSPSNMEDMPFDMKISDNNIIYITGRSMASLSHFDFMTLKLSQPIGINTISTDVPESFSLSQNYPNPFNPSTKIKFEIPATSSVAQTFLSVYNVLGKQVAVLVNQNLQPDTYEVNWNAADFPSGIYFYSLRAGDYSETRKMVLIK